MSTSCCICVKTVLDSDDGVQCDGACGRWFHRGCVNVSKAEYQRMSSNTNIKWYCGRTDCTDPSDLPINKIASQMSSVLAKLDDVLNKINKIEQISKDVSDIKDEVSTIKAGLSALEPRVTKVEDRLSLVEAQVAASDGKIETIDTKLSHLNTNPPHPKVVVEDFIDEVKEREWRAKCIIVHGVPECLKGSTETKVEHDKKLVKNIFDTLSHDLPLEEIKCFRLGKFSDSKPRPIKAILKSPTLVIGILKSFSQKQFATDPDLKSVSLSHDRTQSERQYMSMLKLELENRVENGESLTIKYRNGIPKIVKSKN